MSPGPRWLHRAFADAFGYFWLPCPACGAEFGGQEKHGPVLLSTPFTGKLTCGNCTEAVDSSNAALWRSCGYEVRPA